MSDERKKRSGTQSDEDRALRELARRRSGNTPPAGTPVVNEQVAGGDEWAGQDFTPVGSVFDRIADEMVLSDRERMILRLVWQHTANMEMRGRKRSDSQDTSLLAKRIDDLETRVVDMSGADGTNGKIGNLRKSVDGILSKGWWLITVLVGGIGAAAVKLIIVGRAYGELETKVENNTNRIQLIERATFLKSIPLLVDPAPPGKDHTP